MTTAGAIDAASAAAVRVAVPVPVRGQARVQAQPRVQVQAAVQVRGQAQVRRARPRSSPRSRPGSRSGPAARSRPRPRARSATPGWRNDDGGNGIRRIDRGRQRRRLGFPLPIVRLRRRRRMLRQNLQPADRRRPPVAGEIPAHPWYGRRAAGAAAGTEWRPRHDGETDLRTRETPIAIDHGARDIDTVDNDRHARAARYHDHGLRICTRKRCRRGRQAREHETARYQRDPTHTPHTRL